MAAARLFLYSQCHEHLTARASSISALRSRLFVHVPVGNSQSIETLLMATKAPQGSWDNSPFLSRSMVGGLILLIVGLIALFLSSGISDSPTWATFWAGLSTTLLSVGAIGVMYDGFLKKALLQEIQRAAALSSRIADSGLVDSGDGSDVTAPQALFASASGLTIVPAAPLHWQDQNYDWLLRLASARKMHCRIYLPEPLEYSRLAQQVLKDDPILVSQETCVAKYLLYRRKWDEAMHEAESTLELLYYRGYPHSGFIFSEGAAMIHSPGPTGKALSVYVYEGTKSKNIRQKLNESITYLQAESIDGFGPNEKSVDDIIPPIGREPSSRTSFRIDPQERGVGH
jgi:hypothetical protein